MKPLPRADILKAMKIGASACDGLVRKGFLRETDTEEERIAYEDELGDQETVVTETRPVLTEEQNVAVAAIHQAISAETFSVRLLHGVTGSGKTEVYLNAVEKIVAEGGGVIFLVPEVALAPQTVGRVRARLEARGVHTVVWHSHLSEGERYDAWKALASGEAHVVVGARSAVFAPAKPQAHDCGRGTRAFLQAGGVASLQWARCRRLSCVDQQIRLSARLGHAFT